MEEVSRQGIGWQRGNGLQTRALKMEHLGWAWGCKGNVVGCGGNYGGSPSVCVVRKAIGNQGIREFGENTPYTMVTWLVKKVQIWVIGNVDHWLVWML